MAMAEAERAGQLGTAAREEKMAMIWRACD